MSNKHVTHDIGFFTGVFLVFMFALSLFFGAFEGAANKKLLEQKLRNAEQIEQKLRYENEFLRRKYEGKVCLKEKMKSPSTTSD